VNVRSSGGTHPIRGSHEHSGWRSHGSDSGRVDGESFHGPNDVSRRCSGSICAGRMGMDSSIEIGFQGELVRVRVGGCLKAREVHGSELAPSVGLGHVRERKTDRAVQVDARRLVRGGAARGQRCRRRRNDAAALSRFLGAIDSLEDRRVDNLGRRQ
jgi:hypothetical protein